MIRIDVDHFVIVHIQCRDEQHRYAVPAHYTCRQAANHVWETFHTNHDERRQPSQQFTLHSDEWDISPNTAAEHLKENGYYLVVPLKEEG